MREIHKTLITKKEGADLIKLTISYNFSLGEAKDQLCRYFDSPADETIYDAIEKTEASNVDELLEKLNNDSNINSLYRIVRGV